MPKASATARYRSLYRPRQNCLGSTWTTIEGEWICVSSAHRRWLVLALRLRFARCAAPPAAALPSAAGLPADTAFPAPAPRGSASRSRLRHPPDARTTSDPARIQGYSCNGKKEVDPIVQGALRAHALTGRKKRGLEAAALPCLCDCLEREKRSAVGFQSGVLIASGLRAN